MGIDWGKIINYLKDFFGSKIVVSVLAFLVIISFFNSDFYKETLRRPRFTFEGGENIDVVESDSEVVRGSAVIVPLLIVKYNNIVIYKVELLNYYDYNSDIMTDDKFSFRVDTEQRKKVQALLIQMQKYFEDKDVRDDIEVNFIHLTEINVQNKKSNSNIDGYWIFSDAAFREILGKEVPKWKPDYQINIDKYKKNSKEYYFEDFDTVVRECDDIISEINSQ